MTPICHITTPEAWEQAQRDGFYRAASLDDEGFIHFSTPAQVVATANRYYQGRRDLLLLLVDAARLDAELRYEHSSGGEEFPHLYGALNVAAVTRAVDFPPDADGVWRSLPAGLGDN